MIRLDGKNTFFEAEEDSEVSSSEFDSFFNDLGEISNKQKEERDAKKAEREEQKRLSAQRKAQKNLVAELKNIVFDNARFKEDLNGISEAVSKIDLKKYSNPESSNTFDKGYNKDKAFVKVDAASKEADIVDAINKGNYRYYVKEFTPVDEKSLAREFYKKVNKPGFKVEHEDFPVLPFFKKDGDSFVEVEKPDYTKEKLGADLSQYRNEAGLVDLNSIPEDVKSTLNLSSIKRYKYDDSEPFLLPVPTNSDPNELLTKSENNQIKLYIKGEEMNDDNADFSNLSDLSYEVPQGNIERYIEDPNGTFVDYRNLKGTLKEDTDSAAYVRLLSSLCKNNNLFRPEYVLADVENFDVEKEVYELAFFDETISYGVSILKIGSLKKNLKDADDLDSNYEDYLAQEELEKGEMAEPLTKEEYQGLKGKKGELYKTKKLTSTIDQLVREDSAFVTYWINNFVTEYNIDTGEGLGFNEFLSTFKNLIEKSSTYPTLRSYVVAKIQTAITAGINNNHSTSQPKEKDTEFTLDNGETIPDIDIKDLPDKVFVPENVSNTRFLSDIKDISEMNSLLEERKEIIDNDEDYDKLLDLMKCVYYFGPNTVKESDLLNPKYLGQIPAPIFKRVIDEANIDSIHDTQYYDDIKHGDHPAFQQLLKEVENGKKDKKDLLDLKMFFYADPSKLNKDELLAAMSMFDTVPGLTAEKLEELKKQFGDSIGVISNAFDSLSKEEVDDEEEFNRLYNKYFGKKVGSGKKSGSKQQKKTVKLSPEQMDLLSF